MSSFIYNKAKSTINEILIIKWTLESRKNKRKHVAIVKVKEKKKFQLKVSVLIRIEITMRATTEIVYPINVANPAPFIPKDFIRK